MNTVGSLNEENHEINLSCYIDSFPILKNPVRDKRLVYLDTAASAQKPDIVINTINDFYKTEYANIHRGVYWLSERATVKYEMARKKVAEFLDAASETEIVFTKSATESINLVASSWGGKNLSTNDEVIITELEHHANIVPWHILRESTGIVIKSVRLDDNGCIDLNHFYELLSEKTKLLSLTHASNALGIIPPIKEMISAAHSLGALVLIDGCQGAVHQPVSVQDMDADFYVFSCHKLYGPTGIGVLYAKSNILQDMPPYQGGGDMIVTVSTQESTYADPPLRFEAGTPNIVGAIGLSAAIDFVTNIGMHNISNYEDTLLKYGREKLGELNYIKFYGDASNKASIISFDIDGVHPHDVGTILDQDGISVRVGHHCAQPVMQHFGIAGTVRASFALYNTKEDIDLLINGVEKVRSIFT